VPIPKKVQGIQAIQPPKTRKQLRHFISMINFYRNMWQQRSQLLALVFSEFTSNKVPFDWNETHQTNYDASKHVIGREVILAYPDFNAPFHVYTDASNYKSVQSYHKTESQSLSILRKWIAPSPTTLLHKKELLSIVETLKEFLNNILLGHQVIVHTDHKNLTFKISIPNESCNGA
jgi:hypothetical protein